MRGNLYTRLYLARFLQRVFLISGIAMLVDLAFFGPGLVLPILGLSLRRLLFAVILVVLTLRRLTASLAFSKNDLALIALIFAFALVWAVAIPYSRGFLISQSFADIGPWMSLLILPLWPWDAWPAREQWLGFCRFIVVVSVLLAAAHVGLWALVVSNVISSAELAITAILVSANGDGDSFLRVVPLEGGQYRVFWSSSIFLLGGVYFLSVSKSAMTRKLWYAEITLACLALAATYIRAFLGAIAIFGALSLVLRQLHRRRAFSFPIISVLGTWLIGIVFVSVAINPVFLNLLGLSRDVSDVERVEQSVALLSQFEAHPILGSGFGSYVTQLVRGTEAPYSYELVFYALLMKLGVLGVCALIAILGLALRVSVAQRLAINRPIEFATWLAFTTGLWFAGATNPMVTNFVGMAIVILLFVDMRMRSLTGGHTRVEL